MADAAKLATTTSKRFHRVAELAEHSLAMRKIQERFPNALTVVDATQDKILLVTEADVKSGTQRNPSACAVAQCASRQGLGGMIGRKFAYLIQGSEVTRYHMGKDAQVRTALYDDRGTMTPGPVILTSPSPSYRLANMAKRAAVQRGWRASQKRRRPKTRDGAIEKQKDADVRTMIVTHGFRSWDRA